MTPSCPVKVPFRPVLIQNIAGLSMTLFKVND